MEKEDGTLVSSSWDFFNKSTWKLFIDCYRPIYFRLFIRSSCIYSWGNIPTTSITYTTEGWFTDSQTIIINAIPANGDKSNFLYIRWKFAPNE
jgi:hypothetical protein